MKKLPLVIALSAALVCTLASAQSSVQVYGRLYPFAIDESGKGATPTGTTGMATLAGTPTTGGGVPKIKGMAAGNSHIGFRGTEDLGGGLKAKFQIEGVVNVDDGSTNATAFWNRNTFVGLDGSFGEIKLGLMDTVFKDYGDTLGILGVSSGTPMSSSNMLRKPGFGTSNAARFHERRANSIRYDSPKFGGGFEFGVQVATQENVSTATAQGPSKTYSVGLQYDNGPFYFAVAHEIHDNFFGGSAQAPSSRRNNAVAGFQGSSKDAATQYTVEWRPNKQHKFEFDVIMKEYKEPPAAAGRFASYKNTAYLVAVDSRWNSQWRTAAHYVRSEKGSCTLGGGGACSTDGLEGSKFQIGAAYYFKRSAYLFVAYDQITNGKSARFSNNEFGANTPGEDSRHFIAGFSKSF